MHYNDIVDPSNHTRDLLNVLGRCWARWCLQKAGKSEEFQCRFCKAQLPDYKQALQDGLPAPAPPVMSVHFGANTYLVKVRKESLET